MSNIYLRALPQVDDENRDFWTGGAEGELRIQHCQDCGTWNHPPRPFCPKCLSENVKNDPASGLATIETYTLNYRAWGPGMEVPYVIAVVVLDEQPGLRMTTNIVGMPPEDVRIGMRVRVTFEQDEGVWLPMFAPIAA